MQAVLDRLVSLLPANVQPYAKAAVPVVLGVASLIAQWGATGSFDQTEVLTLVGTVLTALGVFGVRNTNTKLNPDAGVHKRGKR